MEFDIYLFTNHICDSSMYVNRPKHINHMMYEIFLFVIVTLIVLTWLIIKKTFIGREAKKLSEFCPLKNADSLQNISTKAHK